MTRTKSTYLAVLAVLLAPMAANADLIITISDNGSDLTFDYAGSLDTTTFGPSTLIGGFAGSFDPSLGAIVGRILGNTLRYDNAIVSGPTFGTGNGDFFPISLVAPDAASGTTGIFLVRGSTLAIDHTYVSGSAITGSMTYGGHTLASQGIAAGSYLYTIAGSTETITIRTAQVPEPGTLALLGIGLLGMSAARRRRKA